MRSVLALCPLAALRFTLHHRAYRHVDQFCPILAFQFLNEHQSQTATSARGFRRGLPHHSTAISGDLHYPHVPTVPRLRILNMEACSVSQIMPYRRVRASSTGRAQAQIGEMADRHGASSSCWSCLQVSDAAKERSIMGWSAPSIKRADKRDLIPHSEFFWESFVIVISRAVNGAIPLLIFSAVCLSEGSSK